MPESLKALRRRVRSIKSMKQVTRAMEMVAAAKLRRAQETLHAAHPYVDRLQVLLGRLAPRAETEGHPLFAARKVRRSTLVVFAGDRGLCGAFNSNILRMAEKHLKEQRRGSVDLVCVGNRAESYLRRRHWPIERCWGDLGGNLEREVTDQIADHLRDRYLAGDTDEVTLLFTRFVSTSVFKPNFEKYLDLDQSALMRGVQPAARGQAVHDYIFEPSLQDLFLHLVPAYLHAKIYIVLAESLTSEHSARMLAMNNASSNCDELVEDLTLRLNKARQSAITGDLLDIVGGAEALTQGS